MKFKTDKLPFARGYIEAGDKSAEYKIACGMLRAAEEAPLMIYPDKSFPAYEMSGEIHYAYGGGIRFDYEGIEKLIEENKCDTDELREIFEIMKPFDTRKIIDKERTEEEEIASGMKACWGGGWGGHANPDYDMLLKSGTDGIREKIAKYREINQDKDEFYDSLLLTLEALDTVGERLSILAAETAKNLSGEKKKWFEDISGVLKIVPKKPAYDFISACELFWLSFCFCGVDSPGRFDQFMIDFYRKTDKNEARIMLEKLWIQFHDTRTWNLCISGSDEKWNDDTNELTYEILDIAAKYKFNTPNITMRVHRNTPEKLWEAAAATLATGIGMPALYNDETVCRALEALGIPAADAHIYCMNGCNQIDIMGKSHMGLEDGEVSLIKCLEYALFDGYCNLSEKQRSIHTGNAEDFKTFGELIAAYRKQVRYITDIALSMSYESQKAYSEFAPNPYRSNLIQGCIEKGLDYKSGGPLYGHGQILIEGLADTADSLAAIKHFVFEEKYCDMRTLLDALKKDFNGYTELYKKFSTYKKFGNDDEYVDSIAAAVFKDFSEYLLTKHTFRGGIYGSGLSTFNRSASYGEKVGAMPNGKHKADPLLADSIGAVPGCDVNGPTAAINSCMKYEQKLAKSGFVMQLKFDKKLFASPKGLESFINLAKTYFENGGQQLSINVLSAEELIDAKTHPELHKDLIVRVGGYSAYFTEISPDLQDNIIARTNHSV